MDNSWVNRLFKSLTKQYDQPYVGPIKGMIRPGNIDLYNRSELERPDYSHSTVSTITGGIDDAKYVLLPTVIEGVQYSPKEALKRFKDTGEHMGVFENEDLANEYDKLLHSKMGWNGINNKW